MTIWAIADIHASPLDHSGAPSKPMDVFGENWLDHVDRVEAAWNAEVSDGDTVVVAGDLDWSMHLEDALPTLRRMAGWKGRKLLLRGNHDYWWSSKATGKVRQALPPGIELIHNNAFVVEGFGVVGAKGSPVPGGPDWSDVDAKLLNRELARLSLSLAARDPALPTIAVLHYPPFLSPLGTSPYVDLFRRSSVSLCVYGHLHGVRAGSGPEGMHGGIRYVLVAADHVDFTPIRIAENGRICPPSITST